MFESQATLIAYRALGREHGVELASIVFRRTAPDPSPVGTADSVKWVNDRLGRMRDVLRDNGATMGELRAWEASARRTYRESLVAAAKVAGGTIRPDNRDGGFLEGRLASRAPAISALATGACSRELSVSVS